MSSNQSKRELLRQKRKEQKRRKMMTVLFVFLGAAALFAVAITLPKILMEGQKFSGDQGFTIGDQNAPVTVVQFSSYTCGFCKDFSAREEPAFIRNYVDSGQVFFRYVNIPSNDAASQLAAKASYCAADQDQFFNYRGFLYDNSATSDGFSAPNLVNYANSAGLDTEKFQICLDGNTFATAFMDDIQYAQAVGVTFTPSFLVNDQLVDASELVPTVEEQLEK